MTNGEDLTPRGEAETSQTSVSSDPIDLREPQELAKRPDASGWDGTDRLPYVTHKLWQEWPFFVDCIHDLLAFPGVVQWSSIWTFVRFLFVPLLGVFWLMSGQIRLSIKIELFCSFWYEIQTVYSLTSSGHELFSSRRCCFVLRFLSVALHPSLVWFAHWRNMKEEIQNIISLQAAGSHRLSIFHNFIVDFCCPFLLGACV